MNVEGDDHITVKLKVKLLVIVEAIGVVLIPNRVCRVVRLQSFIDPVIEFGSEVVGGIGG